MDGLIKQPGFVRHGGRKPIEIFVESYLRLITSGNRLREERKFIEKAIMLINRVFGHPCCDDATAVVDYGTPYDNQLTTSIRNFIINGYIIRREYRLALLRLLRILETYLYGCCTSPLTVTFDTVTPSQATLQITDVVTGEVVFTSATTGTTQTVNIPAKYFGPASLLKVCLNVITAPPVDTIDTVTPTTGPAIISTGVAGNACSTTIGPLQSTYAIAQVASV